MSRQTELRGHHKCKRLLRWHNRLRQRKALRMPDIKAIMEEILANFLCWIPRKSRSWPYDVSYARWKYESSSKMEVFKHFPMLSYNSWSIIYWKMKWMQESAQGGRLLLFASFLPNSWLQFAFVVNAQPSLWYATSSPHRGSWETKEFSSLRQHNNFVEKFYVHDGSLSMKIPLNNW